MHTDESAPVDTSYFPGSEGIQNYVKRKENVRDYNW